MARGFLRTLAERLAYPFIELGRRLGAATREIGEALSKAGTTLEAASIRRIESEIDVVRAASETALGVAPYQVPDPLNIPDALTKIRRQYAWTFNIQYIDRSGNRITRFLTLSTDTLLSELEARRQALNELAEGDYGFRKGTEISVTTSRVIKAGALGTL